MQQEGAPTLPARPLALGICPSGIYFEMPRAQRPRAGRTRYKSAKARAKLAQEQQAQAAEETTLPGESVSLSTTAQRRNRWIRR